MTWALKRQIFYLVVFVALVGFFIYFIFYPSFHKAPTCFDNKKNGDEVGVDCGGSCAIACTSQTTDVAVLWARSFRVVDGRYNAVAYIENQNEHAAVYKIHYKFRFSDKDNIYIASREGDTFIPPNGKFAIFEPAINVGNTIPVFTTFEFTEKPTWIQISNEKIKELQLTIGEVTLQNEDTTPKMSTTLKNNSLFEIPDIKVITILYDAFGNAVNLSSTYVETLKGGETVPVFFTWPEAFNTKIVKKEIIPMFNMFSVKFN